MSDYVPTDWVDNVTPVDAARMDHIEAGIDVNRDAVIDHETRIDSIEAGKENKSEKGAVNGYAPLGSDTKVPSIYLPAGGGGGGVDYDGAWSDGTPYVSGDVVVHNGIEYLAVNPSTGQTPPALVAQAQPVIPLVTALPSSPFDGQEVDLTDSLTTPSFVWRFRYVSAAPSSKWKFVGGAPLVGEVLGQVSTTSTSYVSLSGGPSVTVPVAGLYDIAIAARMGASGNLAQHTLVSAKLGAAAAGDNESVYVLNEVSTAPMSGSKVGMRRSLAAGAVVEMVYRVGGATTGTYDFRTLQALPVAVG